VTSIELAVAGCAAFLFLIFVLWSGVRAQQRLAERWTETIESMWKDHGGL
jgi:hypothetical protein